MTRNILEKTLKNLGISGNELKVLTFLLEEGGSLKATEIARKVQINRTTLYGILNDLTQRGFVSSTGDTGVARFQSIEPRALVSMLERAKDALDKSKEDVQVIIPALESARKSNQHHYPRVQFFEGVEGIKQVYEDSIIQNQEKKMVGFINYETAIQTLGEEWAHYFIQKRKKNDVFAETIATQTNVGREYKSKDKNQLRSIKFLPREYQFDIEIITYNDKTAFMSFDKENPVAVLIQDKKIAETFKNLFRYVNNSLSTEEKAN